MAISGNLLLKKLSGHLGKEIVFKQYGDKTVVARYPDMSKRVLSPRQRQVNQIMKEANYEAKTVLASEALRNEAQVRLNVTRSRLYTALIREYFRKVQQPETNPAPGSDGKDSGPDS